jgi:hypothetical protein
LNLFIFKDNQIDNWCQEFHIYGFYSTLNDNQIKVNELFDKLLDSISQFNLKKKATNFQKIMIFKNKNGNYELRLGFGSDSIDVFSFGENYNNWYIFLDYIILLSFINDLQSLNCKFLFIF